MPSFRCHTSNILFIVFKYKEKHDTDFYLDCSSNGKGVREWQNVQVILGNKNARCDLSDRGTRDQMASILWIREKARESKKNIYFCFTDHKKDFVWITTSCGKLLKRWEYQTSLPVSWEICMQVKKQQLNQTCNNWEVQNWERSTTRIYIIILFISLICRVHHAKFQAQWITNWN